MSEDCSFSSAAVVVLAPLTCSTRVPQCKVWLTEFSENVFKRVRVSYLCRVGKSLQNSCCVSAQTKGCFGSVGQFSGIPESASAVDRDCEIRGFQFLCAHWKMFLCCRNFCCCCRKLSSQIGFWSAAAAAQPCKI